MLVWRAHDGMCGAKVRVYLRSGVHGRNDRSLADGINFITCMGGVGDAPNKIDIVQSSNKS